MNNKRVMIKKDMSYDDFISVVNAIGLKFSTTEASKYSTRKTRRFDTIVKGNLLYDDDNKQAFRRMIAQKVYEIITNLKFNEVLSCTQSIALLEPCDFDFRVFGEVAEDVVFSNGDKQNCVTINIQFNDFKGDAVKAWNNRVVLRINEVKSLKNADEYINDVDAQLRRKMDWGMDRYSAYIIVVPELFEYLRNFGTAYNVLEASANINNIGSLGGESYTIRFKKSMTFEQVNTENKLSFTALESDSGIRGAKSVLNIGIFSAKNRMYYLARRES